MRKYYLPLPTDYQKKLAELFSHYSFSTNLDEYHTRNQNNVEKIKKDIYNGKLAEFMVFNFLLYHNKNPSPPDIMIYGKKNKNFECDIKTPMVNIHVKSCDATSPYPNSWLFQPEDTLTFKPKENDFLFLTVIGNSKPFTYVYSAKNVSSFYKEPIKKTLNKKVIYEKDLIEHYEKSISNCSSQ